MSTKAIPTGLTAHEILDGVTAKQFTKTAAVEFLTTRCANRVAKGRIPTKPSLDALAKLDAPFEFQRDQVRTRKQISKGTPTLAERKTTATAKPKNAKRKTRRTSGKATHGLDINALIAEHGEQEVMAAFLSLASTKKK